MGRGFFTGSILSAKVLRVVTLGLTLLLLQIHWQRLAVPTDVAAAAAIFAQSQYVQGDARAVEASDEVVYITAADDYWSGADPTGINFEHPPLGKYLQGLSLRLTGNILWVNVFAFAGTLLAFGYTCRNLGLSANFTLVALLGLGLNQLMIHLVGLAMLDTLYVFFLTAFFACLLAPGQGWGKTWGLGLTLGLFLGTKYFFPLGFFLLCPWIYLIHCRSVPLAKVGLSLLVTLGVYLLGYAAYFAAGHDLLAWLSFEKWRFWWWVGERPPTTGQMLSTLFLGHYTAWWATPPFKISETTWSPLWPILALGTTFWGTLEWFKHRRNQVLTVLLFAGAGMLAAHLVGGTQSLKYLAPCLPLWFLTLGYLGKLKQT